MNAIPFDGYPNSPGPSARGNYAANAGPRPRVATEPKRRLLPGEFSAEPARSWASTTKRQVAANSGWLLQHGNVHGGALGRQFERSARRLGHGLSEASVTAANAIGVCTTPNNRDNGADGTWRDARLLVCGYWHSGCQRVARPVFWAPVGPDVGPPNRQSAPRRRQRGFADGSVRFIGNYIFQGTWFYMLSTQDGVAYAYRFETPARFWAQRSTWRQRNVTLQRPQHGSVSSRGPLL